MLHGLFPIFGILIAFIIITAVAKRFLSSGGQQPNDFPYKKETVLFSPTERSFFGVLEQAVNNRLRIMGKVRLADVVKVKSGMNKSSWQKAFNRIQSKHIDFVACDPSTLSVQFAIELDDRSHNNSNRQKRDEFVDKVLQSAGIPIYHFTAKQTYSVEDIRKTLFDGEEVGKKKRKECHPFKGSYSSNKAPICVRKRNFSRFILVTECLHHCRSFI